VTAARRREDWNLQADVAEREAGQIDKQLEAARIRLDIANKELELHEKQIANAEEVSEFFRTKFTNEQLYSWMRGQLAAAYGASYRLACELAKRAERAYRFELGIPDAAFIQMDHWDNLRAGLLAGEKLQRQLRAMDASFLEKNRRELEITRSISLAKIAPHALVELRARGECLVEIPESVFDCDYPGHYFRRIKSVAVNFPSSTVTNRIRVSPQAKDAGDYAGRDDDARFVLGPAGTHAIVTSSGTADAGMFDVSLRDERYLPFEGAGVVGTWHVRLPQETNEIDRKALADVVLHVRYTARDAGEPLAGLVRDAVVMPKGGRTGWHLAMAKEALADEWQRFLEPEAVQDEHVLSIPLDLPPHGGELVTTLSSLTIFLVLRQPKLFKRGHASVTLTPPGAAAEAGEEELEILDSRSNFDDLARSPFIHKTSDLGLGTWTLRLKKLDGVIAKQPEPGEASRQAPRIDPREVVNVGILCGYHVPVVG
jgi:hypothetical protein